MSNYSFIDDVNKRLSEELSQVAEAHGVTKSALLEKAAQNLHDLRTMMNPVSANKNASPTIG